MNFIKAIIVTAALLTTSHISAQSTPIATFSVSNGSTYDMLWAPISAVYSPTSSPTKMFSMRLSSSFNSIQVFSLATNGSGASQYFQCGILPSSPILHEAIDIFFSLDESSVLEIFSDKSSPANCFRIVLQKRSDFLAATGDRVRYGASTTAPIYVSSVYARTHMRTHSTGGGLTIKTDWPGNIQIYAHHGSNYFSCTISTTNPIYSTAVKIKNSLRNGYTLEAYKPSSLATECSSIEVTFTTTAML